VTGDVRDRLEPGELLVRVLRGELTMPPDHVAIARANRAMANWEQRQGEYRGGAPNEAQRACLEGSP
jgi:hypothetical protein